MKQKEIPFWSEGDAGSKRNQQCMTHKIRHHGEASYTDDQDEWTAVSVLRMCQKVINT